MTAAKAAFRRFLASTAFLYCGVTLAQGADATYHFAETTKVFRIDNGKVTYAFGVNEEGGLQSLYWGARLSDSDALPAAKLHPGIVSFDLPANTTPQEYSGWGGGVYTEPALKISFLDGNRDLVLRYASHRVSADGLHVVLKDIERNISVDLFYSMDAATGILARQATVHNGTGEAVRVEQAAAGNLYLPAGDQYVLHYLAGRWAGEFTPESRVISAGKTVLESRRGSTGHQNSPWFAVERQAPEVTGAGTGTWFGALAWSGSWEISVEDDTAHQVRITAGYNPFDFGYKLAPGADLQSPVLYVGYTGEGMAAAARILHRFERSRIVPQAPTPKLRPVLYNSWEATEMKVDERGQEELARKAASLGVERFVMDDGWFGARNDDHAGLGDWRVNPSKFPHGLKPLIETVHSLGMDFGLWVEPEMVNPDSDLYRRHPDWVLNFPNRPRTEGRNQLVLNLARSDVRDYLFDVLDRLVSENDIAFLKWDYNRNWSEPGWPAVKPDEQQRVYVDFTRNLYSILQHLRAKHPGLEIESCSGGGGRVDLGILRYTDEVWTSDNTDAFDRLKIQGGFTQAYAPALMMAWVTDTPSFADERTTSLDYRFLVAMQGSLGVGSNLNKWTETEFAVAKSHISDYKDIRAIVQGGELYPLLPASPQSEFAASESVLPDKTKAVLFAFLHSSVDFGTYPTLRAQGLVPDRIYQLHALHGVTLPAGPSVASGRYWMEHGFTPPLRGDFKAAAYTLEASTP